MALSEARRKWVEDQVATAVGRLEQEFKFLALETAARRRKEVTGSQRSQRYATIASDGFFGACAAWVHHSAASNAQA